MTTPSSLCRRARPALPTLLTALAAFAALACGKPDASAPGAADSAAAPVPSVSSTPTTPGVPTLVIGGRYETTQGVIVCPRPEPLTRLTDAAERGDTAAFMKTIADERCSPVVAGATVHVAEQRDAFARVRRGGDTTTYWTIADRLAPIR